MKQLNDLNEIKSNSYLVKRHILSIETITKGIILN